jgi:RecB family endonuclease NucS
VRLVIADCSVDYVGRLTAHLPEATRLLLLKADGSLSIHADDRAYKPLMWMSPPCSTSVADDVWTVTNKGGEQLVITLGRGAPRQRARARHRPRAGQGRVEKHLQELLADRCEVLGAGFVLVQREYFTDIGPVDLLCRDETGGHVLVEVKRHAEIDGVEQLTRYLQRVSTVLGEGVRGVLAAQTSTTSWTCCTTRTTPRRCVGLVLPAPGPVHVELAAEPGTGVVEVRARPTGPGADEVLALLRPLGAVYSR